MPIILEIFACVVIMSGNSSVFPEFDFEIDLPEEIPSGPVYDISSTSLVDFYCPDCFGDLDGDGVVTDADFRLWIASKMADKIEIMDVDSDGYLTVIDEVESVARLFDKWSGDLNADGVVDTHDLSLFLDRYSSFEDDDLLYYNRATADIDIDGNISIHDLESLLARMAMNHDVPDRIAVAVDILANVDGTMTSEFYLAGHVKQISMTWPDHHASTSRGMPRWSPPNHDYGMSIQWTPHITSTSDGSQTTPSHGSQNSGFWPAMHWASISNQWYPGHQNQVSRHWPPNHGTTVSTSWHESPGGHLATLSHLWPPDHQTHLSQTLIPTNHDKTFSAIQGTEGFPPEGKGYPAWPQVISMWSPHLQTWSATWPATHDQALSQAFYPPNHTSTISASWLRHQLNFSAHWPTNHLMAVSQTWPGETPTKVPDWPPNHGTSVSKNWSDPIQPTPPFSFPPLFPPGHTLFTTGMDLVPFLPLP